MDLGTESDSHKGGARGTTVVMGSCLCGLMGFLGDKRCALQVLFAQSRRSLLLSSAAARVVLAQHLRFGGTTLGDQIQC